MSGEIPAERRGRRRLPIEALLDGVEVEDFSYEIGKIASKNAQIMGVLAIGSMVQTETPDTFYDSLRPGRLSAVYESIRRPQRRQKAPSSNSDLDIWVCTRDNETSRKSRRIVELGGMALLEELVSGTLRRDTTHWRSKKLDVFGRYYKKPNLYDEKFDATGSEPWMATEFKQQLEDMIVRTMPSFVRQVSRTMDKSLPGNFLEVRAFPESLFHLRPDDSILPDGSEDRAPFPRIADEQWISTEHNAHIFYARDGVSIHPFVEGGDVLGLDIDQHIRHMEERERHKVAVGGILLKPDALESGQMDMIRDKISARLAEHGGKIVMEKKIEQLTDEQIDTIYPLINPDDLSDLREYLQSGEVVAMLVELPCDPYGVFQVVNSIKGGRVGDRSVERLYEGRITDGAVRDLLPLPGDEERYLNLISTILRRRANPTVRFSEEDYKYYARNLMHTPDNSIELQGLIDLVSPSSSATEVKDV